MTTTIDEGFLNRKQAAERVGVTYQTILLWERAGRLHAIRGDGTDGADLLIRVSELDRASARSKETLDPSLVWRADELRVRRR
jgi:hypothetical protein